jgi:mRNA-degrading endonuclease YafQ of YafQ-DinJ toxin-antitoxin module
MAKKLRILGSFKKDYSKLPLEIKDKVDKQLDFLLNNPGQPSLNLHPVQGTKGIREGYVDYHYRFTFEIDGNFYVLRKVGTHDILKNP